MPPDQIHLVPNTFEQASHTGLPIIGTIISDKKEIELLLLFLLRDH